ncbi:unnamed protein product [Prunus brigantina]
MSLLFSLTVSLCFMCSTFSDFLLLCSRLGSSLPISMSFLGLLVIAFSLSQFLFCFFGLCFSFFLISCFAISFAGFFIFYF